MQICLGIYSWQIKTILQNRNLFIYIQLPHQQNILIAKILGNKKKICIYILFAH